MGVRSVPAAAALLASISAAGAADEERTAREASNVETVIRLFEEGWGASPGWESVWRATMAQDFRYHFHSHPPKEGLEVSIEFNLELFAGFPELAVEIEEIVAEGDVVIARTILTGTHDGVFLGVPATGKVVTVPDITLFRFAGGEVVEQRYFTDLLAVMTTIGAVEN